MRSESEARAAVIAEARTWIKTPWVHAADIKGAGVDCVEPAPTLPEKVNKPLLTVQPGS